MKCSNERSSFQIPTNLDTLFPANASFCFWATLKSCPINSCNHKIKGVSAAIQYHQNHFHSKGFISAQSVDILLIQYITWSRCIKEQEQRFGLEENSTTIYNILTFFFLLFLFFFDTGKNRLKKITWFWRWWCSIGTNWSCKKKKMKSS